MGQFKGSEHIPALAFFGNPSQRDYYKLTKSKVQLRKQSPAALAQSRSPTDQKQRPGTELSAARCFFTANTCQQTSQLAFRKGEMPHQGAATR